MADAKTVKVLQTLLPHKETVLTQVLRYGGLKSLGAIMSSRKGIFGVLAIGLSYYLLLGRLPEDAPADVIAKMGEIFGMLVGVVSGLFIGGTALEDALSKGARRSGAGSLIPFADAAGKAHTAYIETGDVDPVEVCRAIVKSADEQNAKRK
jgi:hypothetical protein